MTRIGKFYHFLTPEILRDVAFIPSILKRVQWRRVSWIRSIIHSFKILLCFWLHKIPGTISSPNLKKVCNMWKMTSKKTGQQTEKTWGRVGLFLVVSTKWRNISLVSRGGNRQGEGGLYTGYKVYSKKIKNTTTRTTSAIWRIFVEPIQTTLCLFYLPRNRPLKMNLTSIEVSMF